MAKKFKQKSRRYKRYIRKQLKKYSQQSNKEYFEKITSDLKVVLDTLLKKGGMFRMEDVKNNVG